MSIVSGFNVNEYDQNVKVGLGFFKSLVAEKYGIVISDKIVPYYQIIYDKTEDGFMYFGRIDILTRTALSWKTDDMSDYIESGCWWFMDCFKRIELLDPELKSCLVFKGWRVAI